MKITDLLRPEGIKINAVPSDQMDAIDQLVALQDASGNIADTVEYKKAILAREGEFSTAVGDGIAILHAKTKAVKKPPIRPYGRGNGRRGLQSACPRSARRRVHTVGPTPEEGSRVHQARYCRVPQ